jgi:hypothetical protein
VFDGTGAVEALALFVVDITEDGDVAIRAVVRAATREVDAVLGATLPRLFVLDDVPFDVELVFVDCVWVREPVQVLNERTGTVLMDLAVDVGPDVGDVRGVAAVAQSGEEIDGCLLSLSYAQIVDILDAVFWDRRGMDATPGDGEVWAGRLDALRGFEGHWIQA